MIDDRELELISAAIDGELDVDERAELDWLLESSDEARECKAELEQLDSLLKSVPEIDPPESLHARIMARASTPPSQHKASVVDRLGPLVPGAGLRYALAASAGAVFAAAVVAIFYFGDRASLPVATDHTDLVGTIAPDVESADADIIDSFAMRGEQLEVQIRLRSESSVFFLDIQADTKQRLDISVDLGGAGLWPDAVAQIDGRSESISIIGQALQVQAFGQQQITILLRPADDTAFAEEAEITLEISSQGTLLQRGALTANLEGVMQ